MSNKHRKATAAVALLLLTSCGGGGSESTGGSGTSNHASPTVTTHAVQLGPIVGANVTVYRSDCKSVLYQTTTDQDGNYSVDVGRIQVSLGNSLTDLLCVEATGGKDVDPNDDGIRGSDEAIAMQGSIRGYVRAQDLLGASGTKLNLFGAAIADMLKDSSDVTEARIAQVAAQLSVPDVDKDGKITIADVTRYQMGAGSNGEASLRDFYLRTLHENDTTARQAYVDNVMTTLVGIRDEVQITAGGEAKLVLTAFSSLSTIRYGRALAVTLPNIYTSPIAITANEVIFMQECTSSSCLPAQSIQIAASGRKIMEYSDTNGIDLSEQVANQAKRATLLAKIEADKAQISTLTSELAAKNATLQAVQAEIDQIASDNRLLDAEIERLQNP